MKWDGIRYFLALAQDQTLADTAATLGVSDATVMRRIQGLEASLRTRLFVRGPAGHELTPKGEMLLPVALEMRQLAARVQHDYADDDGQLTGTVAITTTEFGSDYVLVPMLPAFRQQHPTLNITINVSPVHVDLVQPEPGLGLRFERPERGPYVISKLGEVLWGYYLSRPLAKNFGLRQNEMVSGNESFIGWAPPVDSILVARAARRSFPKGSAAVSVSTLRAQIEAARAGIGIAHIPCAMGDADKTLIRVNSAEPLVALEAWLVMPTQYKHLARLKAVATFVREAFSNSMSARVTR